MLIEVLLLSLLKRRCERKPWVQHSSQKLLLLTEPTALRTAVAAAERLETLRSCACQPVGQAVPAKRQERKAKPSAGAQGRGKGKHLPAIETGLLAGMAPADS